MNLLDLLQLLEVVEAGVSAATAWISGRPFWLLLVLMTFDIATGTLVAYKDRRVSSKISRDGMLRKAGVLLAVAFGALVEPLGGFGGVPVSGAIATLFCVPEALSVAENLRRLGVNVPLAERLQNPEKSTGASKPV
jgi:toxin secretion/phage lysis holin